MKGLTTVQGRALGREGLEPIQIYKGLVLTICRTCTGVMIFDLSEEGEDTVCWACDHCDRTKQAAYAATQQLAA